MNALGPGLSKINMAASLPQSVIAVVAADVDPLQSIWRPGSAPAAVVGGVGEGRANERKAMEAVMEAVMEERAVMEAVPERER